MRMDQQPTATISGLLQIGMSPKRCPVWTSTKTMFQMHGKTALCLVSHHVNPSKITRKPLTGWSIFDEFGKSLICTMFLKIPSCTPKQPHLPSMLSYPKRKIIWSTLIRRGHNSWRDSHPNQIFNNFKPGIVFFGRFISFSFKCILSACRERGYKFTQQLGLDGCHIQWPSTLDFPISHSFKDLVNNMDGNTNVQ